MAWNSPIPARRDTGEHPLQHHPGELITAGEVLTGPTRHLLLACLRAHPRPRDRDAPSTERDRTVITAVAIGDPIGIVLALRAAHLIDL